MDLSIGKAIILFRFHGDFDVVKERVKTLQYFNPDLSMYGLFGGSEGDFNEANSQIGHMFENIWFYPKGKDKDWKWIHGDLMAKQWFKDFGHSIDFDFVFSYEYDLLTVAPLKDIYPNIDQDSIALSAVTELSKVKDWWYWTSHENMKPKYLEFKEHMKTKYGLVEQKYASLGPGALFSRKFMEKFADAEDTEWTIEEVTLPAYAEVFGFKLVDHGMHPGFNAPKQKEKLFNCLGNEVSLSDIDYQLSVTDGVRAFHPVKYKVALEELMLK
ncbi:MAG: hypothetical protein AAB395_04035 [Patescibacteria group bacterium]